MVQSLKQVPMKRDIMGKEDIKRLVNAFYDRVRNDELIAHFFIEVIQVHWDTHLPVMYAFWENVLFHRGTYTGNPMEKHLRIHALSTMEPKHFERWLKLFFATVDELYEGERASLIKVRAKSIADVMNAKMTTG
jgi:hemoglobin